MKRVTSALLLVVAAVNFFPIRASAENLPTAADAPAGYEIDGSKVSATFSVEGGWGPFKYTTDFAVSAEYANNTIVFTYEENEDDDRTSRVVERTRAANDAWVIPRRYTQTGDNSLRVLTLGYLAYMKGSNVTSWDDIDKIGENLDVQKGYRDVIEKALTSAPESPLNAAVLMLWANATGYHSISTQVKDYVDNVKVRYRIISEEEVSDAAQSSAANVLGEYDASAPFFERAEFSARLYIELRNKGEVSAGVPITRADAASSSDYGNDMELKREYVLSLFDLLDLDHGAREPSVRIQRDGNANMSPVDVATATYALRSYIALDQQGALETANNRMNAWGMKLQATMGLASRVLSPSNAPQGGEGSIKAVTQDEIDAFLKVAYGSALSSDLKNLYGLVGYPRSSHLGREASQMYYYYLVVCYQEFGYYASALLNVFAPMITNSATSFAAYRDNVKSLKSLYDAVSWANDDALWEFWSKENGETSPKKIYDYLMSINAFDGVSEYVMDETSALRYFFSTASGTQKVQISDLVTKGIVASASFLPMKSNVYDPYTWSGLVDNGWLLNFHSKFGYHRKALYIDKNVDAALNYHRTGSKGGTRVCTLADLLAPEKDIVLYLDDNLYNVNKLAELTDKAFTRLDNVDSASSQLSVVGRFVEFVSNIWDASMENIAKTAEATQYSKKIHKSVLNSDSLFGSHKWSDYFFDKETAASYLSPDTVWNESSQTIDDSAEATTYSPMMSFAALSAVYWDESGVFESLNTMLSKNTPVFISSPSLPFIDDADDASRATVFNYLLLKNLNSQMSVDYAANLDMTSPVYMDLYGNIVTESGIVAVPAAANASLWSKDYRPYNAAFYSTYGDDYTLEYDKNAGALNDVLAGYLAPVDGVWRLSRVDIIGGQVDLSRLSTADKESLAAIAEIFNYDVQTGNYDPMLWQMLITEVLRGAPIEYIDKDFEGLNLSHRVTLNGLAAAKKLEFLVDALSQDGINTTLAVPNPAFMDGIEYVVFFAFKVLILAVLVIWMATIYVDAVGGGVSIRTGVKCIGAVVLVLSLIVGIPTAFEISYYMPNKLLLQSETEYLMMLNLEKSESGQEIGITEVHEPTTSTKLYLKLADIDMPWYDLLPRILISSSASNLEALYKEYEEQHPISMAENVTTINDTVYISTDDLFKSSAISFNQTTKLLFQQSVTETPASYYTPYYYFLDQLIYKANNWSSANNYYAYSTKVQRGGRLKTVGYVQPYFTSEEFMEEGMDYFGLYTLYGVTPPMQQDELLYGPSVYEATRASQWCNMEISDSTKIKRIEKINAYCRKWVADNRGMLGKVTDETFLKCLALSCAMEHNRLFNTARADTLEIYNMSNEDLMRLSIEDPNTVMQKSSLSYARFIFTTGGTPAVYAAALLTLVNFVSAWVKPVATMLVFCITFVSIFIFKLILRRNNNSIYGYVCTILLMCCVNIVGSVMLKLSMFIPRTGLTPTVCIIAQIIVMCAHIYMLCWIISTAVKDWRDVGFQSYSIGFDKMTHRKKFSIDKDTPRQKSGWDYYNILRDRQRRRYRRL